MNHSMFDRNKLLIKKLAERKNKLHLENDLVPLSYEPENLCEKDRELIRLTADRIRSARKKERSVILAFGAHTIKNGLAPVLIALIRDGWIKHLATNGAGIIHDWEFAFHGSTSEDVRENVTKGEFGIWEETGRYINLALIAGAWEGLGYGESIGKMISLEGLTIPDPDHLINESQQLAHYEPEKAAAAIDFAGVIRKNDLKTGFMKIDRKSVV